MVLSGTFCLPLSLTWLGPAPSSRLLLEAGAHNKAQLTRPNWERDGARFRVREKNENTIKGRVSYDIHNFIRRAERALVGREPEVGPVRPALPTRGNL